VPPELEEQPGLAIGGPVEELDRIGPEAAVERHEVGTLQHIDRIHLDQVQAPHHTAQMPQIGGAAGPGVGEALGSQHHAPGLRDGERFGYGHGSAR
jgi:hypothetical protein